MPYVNIRITREGATPEQKAALIRGATQLLVDVLGKNPQTTVVVIDEVETDNWGVGGETVTRRRKQGKYPVVPESGRQGDRRDPEGSLPAPLRVFSRSRRAAGRSRSPCRPPG